MDFAKEVKTLREAKNWFQSDLAKLANISRSSIAAIEAGVMIPETMSASILINLAKAFDLPPLYFFFSSGILKEDEVSDLPAGYFKLSVEEKLLLESIVTMVVGYTNSQQKPPPPVREHSEKTKSELVRAKAENRKITAFRRANLQPKEPETIFSQETES